MPMTLFQEAKSLEEKQQWEQAIASYQAAIAKASHDVPNTALLSGFIYRCYEAIANVYNNKLEPPKYDEAILYYRKAFAALDTKETQELEHIQSRATCQINIADIYAEDKKPDLAIKYYQQAANTLNSKKSRACVSHVKSYADCLFKAAVHYDDKDEDTSIQHAAKLYLCAYNSLTEIAEDNVDILRTQANYLRYIGRCYSSTKTANWTLSLKYHSDAENTYKKISPLAFTVKDIRNRAFNLYRCSIADERLVNYKSALAFCLDAEKYLDSSLTTDANDLRDRAEYLEKLGCLYQALKPANLGKSLCAFKKAADLLSTSKTNTEKDKFTRTDLLKQASVVNTQLKSKEINVELMREKIESLQLQEKQDDHKSPPQPIPITTNTVKTKKPARKKPAGAITLSDEELERILLSKISNIIETIKQIIQKENKDEKSNDIQTPHTNYRGKKEYDAACNRICAVERSILLFEAKLTDIKNHTLIKTRINMLNEIDVKIQANHAELITAIELKKTVIEKSKEAASRRKNLEVTATTEITKAVANIPETSCAAAVAVTTTHNDDKQEQADISKPQPDHKKDPPDGKAAIDSTKTIQLQLARPVVPLLRKKDQLFTCTTAPIPIPEMVIFTNQHLDSSRETFARFAMFMGTKPATLSQNLSSASIPTCTASHSLEE